MSADQDQAVAAALLPLLGGAGNITGVAHCMTRLRLGLRDGALVDEAALTALPAVLGVVDGATYQIVLGPGVARVARAFEELLARQRAQSQAPAQAQTPAPAQGLVGSEPAATVEATAVHPATAEQLAERGAALRGAARQRNATPAKEVLRRIADIFVPLIPALIGSGVIAGVAGLFTTLHWLPALVPALNAISGGFLALIAVFVGYHTARVCGGTPMLGGAAAAVIVFPGVSHVSAFGQQLTAGQGGVLGALGAAALASRVERGCRRRVPAALDVLVTPTLTLLVTGLVTLFGLMFVAGHVAAAVGTAAGWLMARGGAFAGLLLGGLFLPLVMLGLHQALIPIHTTLIEQHGYTVLLPILAMAGAGQVGCALAVYLRLRHNPSIRATIRSALPTGLLGVGEPLIYGVSLPLGRPFVTACLGGAAGGAFIGLCSMLGTEVGSTAIGPSGWALFPLLKGNHGLGSTLLVYAGGLFVGYLAGFLATYCFGFTKAMLAELNAEEPGEAGPDGDPVATALTGRTG
ncbi:PTS transporter subunit EIIC [Kitasatospora sp. NBC_01250]|uniref:PTS transporter subunit EIIC n=1 Tax=Kitasatospora sp. NBC_01250 TaxID=2903571 RepID=UPI002E2EA595|nr:PTS transporter subunit EIIC [Kitasatospora sp. NBC_01250]